MTLHLSDIGYGSDTGCVRQDNEDCLAADAEAGLLVVADGMGGHADGEVASRITVDTVVDSVLRRSLSLAEAVIEANRAVVAASQTGDSVPGMGTTVVVCRVNAEAAEVAWVGDSRAYLVRAGQIELLTHDHTLVQSLVDQGVVSRERALHHPDRHILLRCIGQSGLGASEVGAVRPSINPGDRLLLCSDGLTGELADEEIAAIVADRPGNQAAADALIAAARDAGGHDNITVALATVEN